MPDCGSGPQWPVFHYKNSPDSLQLLPDGVLRHYLYPPLPNEDPEFIAREIDSRKELFVDYPPGKYCIDKVIDYSERP